MEMLLLPEIPSNFRLDSTSSSHGSVVQETIQAKSIPADEAGRMRISCNEILSTAMTYTRTVLARQET